REAHEARLALAAIDARMGHVRRARAGYRALLNSAPDYETLMAAQSGLGALLPTEQALPHLRAAADLAVAQRRALPMEELQARYSSETAHQHMALSRCLLDLGDVAGALMCIWEVKAGPLLDLRAAASALDSTAQSTLAAIKNELARWRMAAAEHQQKVRRALEAKNSDQAAYHRAEAERARSSAQVSEQQLIVAMHTLDDRVARRRCRASRRYRRPCQAIRAC
ncbi:MAG: hypothetical protein HGA65_20985, partial [Oscillochloris sp.]|nr:hypothetical protein [Oscillochloris sp.]